MCGISGFYNIHKQAINPDLLETFLDIQHHRGPDARGTFYNHFVGLAHNRLSLIDLSNHGNQPFVKEDYVLVYNGEIYNYLELKEQLSLTALDSTSDTAVLFEALRAWGIEKTLKAIKGMFAFALFNRKTEELVLARDRVGIKPLFYGFKNSTYYFSSEVKTILAADTFEIHPNRVLYSIFGNLEKANELTGWKEIYHVPPGSYLVINRQGHECKSYFKITELVEEQEYLRLKSSNKETVIEEFDNLMQKSVSSYLMGDAEVGAFVSGGIDSSLIASYSSGMREGFKMFSANVVGKFSEIDFARSLSKDLQVPLYESTYKPEMAIEDLVETTWHYESPLVVHFNAIAFRKVAALARKEGVKAVLTGEGADELFLGYPRLLTQRYDGLLKSPYHLLNKIYNRHEGLKKYLSGGKSGLEHLLVVASQGFERQINRQTYQDVYSFLSEKSQKEHYQTAQMMMEGIVSLLWRNDRMGMAHSIESRFPFLDENILKFSMNLPISYKIGVTNRFHNYKHPFLTDKYIVRKIGEKRLPSSLARKKKKGFPVVGLQSFEINKRFFKNGFVENLIGINHSQFDYMMQHYPSNFIGKFLALEIWGKLFVLDESRQKIHSEVLTHVTLKQS